MGEDVSWKDDTEGLLSTARRVFDSWEREYIESHDGEFDGVHLQDDKVRVTVERVESRAVCRLCGTGSSTFWWPFSWANRPGCICDGCMMEFSMFVQSCATRGKA